MVRTSSNLPTVATALNKERSRSSHARGSDIDALEAGAKATETGDLVTVSTAVHYRAVLRFVARSPLLLAAATTTSPLLCV
ncbi:hypothetical protein GUJ93_ZPchr0013g34515 [Zizania palustris]|uniref:Uncharacterized protein n=1 Tax=Zizania palustris TaxID=103762 RepID=A0A8J6BYH6_ZIZPA|nr:hypothetical protein GUJ93_ZPchr0013g34515 [Zizania palustris]